MKRKSMEAGVRVLQIVELVKLVNTANTVTVVAPVGCVVAGALLRVVTPPREITFTQIAPPFPQVATPQNREYIL